MLMLMFFIGSTLSLLRAETKNSVHPWQLQELIYYASGNYQNPCHAKTDHLGFVQGVCGAPHFNSPGRATEGQAFFLLMEAAYRDLKST